MVSQSFTLNDFELFFLIFMRMASFVFVAPFFSQNGVPNRTKIGLAGVIAVLMFYTIDRDAITYEYESVIGYAVIVAKEVLTGLLIGWAANICSYIVMFAGNMIDMNIGLSMASEFDPTFNVQVTITGSIYSQFLMLLMITSNTYQYILKAFIDSFELIPLGATVFRTDVLLEGLMLYATDLFLLGFRITMPVFAVILIMNVILGVMAKVAPQMNMFSVGMQLKVLAGLSVLFVMVFLFPEVAELIFKEISLEMGNMMDGLHE